MPETVVHFQVRMPPDIHERLASWAKDHKASINQLVVEVLGKAVEQHQEKLQPTGARDTIGAGAAGSHLHR